MKTNIIYNENCLDTMKNRISDNSIDLTVTSPPYDNLRDYNGYEFDFESIAKELYRITKDGCVVVWIVGDATINGSETGTSFKQALFFKEIGFKLHDTMIYQSDKQPMSHNRYEQNFEYMFIFVKGKLNTFNPIKTEKINKSQSGKIIRQRKKDGGFKENMRLQTDKKRIQNIWYYQTGCNITDHPAIFPENLARDHILSWSNENDIVYDPFMGSGTTAKMAYITNRKYIGSEISKEYYDISIKRLDAIKNQTNLFNGA